MKNLLIMLLIAASINVTAQKNVVKFDFKEIVAIEDVDEEKKFATYRPLWNDEGRFIVEINADEKPIHLMVHTESNQSFHLMILPADEKKDVPIIEWNRSDRTIDLKKY